MLLSPVLLHHTVSVESGRVDATFSDYNVRNGCLYDYVAVIKSSNSAVSSYRDSVQTQWTGWSIVELAPQTSEVEGFEDYLADPKNVWKFKYNVSIGDFS